MSSDNLFSDSITRREWLRRAGVLSGSAVFVGAFPEWMAAFVQQPAPATDQLAAMRAGMGATPITSSELGPGLTMLAGPGGNVVVLNGADGKVVVDTFVQPAWTNLKAALDKMGSQRIATVIDTHWHFDHADNNEAFRKAGAAIVAHDNTKKRLSESHDLLGASSRRRRPTRCRRRPSATTHRLEANGETVDARVHSAGAHRYRHLHQVPEGQRPAPGRRVLQRHVSVHRRQHGRQHQRDDQRRDVRDEAGRCVNEDRARSWSAWRPGVADDAIATCSSRCATAWRN